MTDYDNALATWRTDRIKALLADDGWLNIISRTWLEEGTVKVGKADDNDIILSAGPDHVGTLVQNAQGQVTFAPADGGETITLKLDKAKPPRFTSGQLLLEVTTLNGRNALRVRDSKSTARQDFPGIDNYPDDPSWRFVADWVALDQPITMEVDTVLGIPTEVTITHKAVFTRDGVTYELLPTHGTATKPQFVFKDPTSRGETYGACRFLYGEDITEATIVIDFNKAFNPPCAFSEHAVCPLPPPQNVLPMRVEAGELAPKGH